MFLLLVSACDFSFGEPGDTGGTACTELAAASLTLEVVGGQGQKLLDATATFTVDGGESSACESWGDGSFVCGIEQAGHIEATIEAEGFVTGSTLVDVEMDEAGCHVVGQAVTVQLEQESGECTEVVRPSVEVSLATDGAPLANPSVSWSMANADMAAQPCDGSGAAWTCGEEVAGDLEIWASAAGFDSVYVPVTVGLTEDECHVDTESVEITFEATPRE